MEKKLTRTQSETELRTALEYLYLIKAHMRSLDGALTHSALEFSPFGMIQVRRSALDVIMVIEELMLLSVSAHKQAGEEISRVLQNNFNASKKMHLLSKLNPKFFPDAIAFGPSDIPGIDGQFLDVSEDYLTRDQAKEYYHFCDHLLHASNKQMTLPEFESSIQSLSKFYLLTRRLLESFEVNISVSSFIVIGMLNLDSADPPELLHATLGDG